MTKVLLDKSVIDRAIDALAREQVMAKDDGGNYTINVTPKHVMDSLAELREVSAQAVEPEWYHGIDQYGCHRFYHKTEAREARYNTPLYTHPAPEKPCILSQEHSDSAAVDKFAAAMKEKLSQARDKGRGGWESCSEETLSKMLRDHVEKGDPRDVANFCMFIHTLGYRIATAAPAARPLESFAIKQMRQTSLALREKLSAIGSAQAQCLRRVLR